jgi:hypothetical protein
MTPDTDRKEDKMRIIKTITLLFFFGVLFSCATGSSIVTGTVRPAISPDEVTIYLDPPLQYETIGIVEASSKIELSTQAARDRSINELKAQAARIGANGVHLISVGSESKTSLYASSRVVSSSTSTILTARGYAIFVIQE